MEYRVFTSMLQNRGRIEKSVNVLRLKLEVLEYAEEGVKGIDYAITPSSGNPSVKAQKRLDLIEEKEQAQKEILLLESMMKETDEILARMPEDLQQMLIDKFVDGMTYEELGRKHGYSDSGMIKVLKRETELYL